VIVPFSQKRHLRGLNEPTLSGLTLLLTAKVRYLGLLLDKGLTCKAQMKKVMNIRPTGLFGAVRAHLVKPEV
jgi:hypothetical protein